MNSKENLQLYFKEIVKVNSSFRGIDKIRKNLDYACDLFVHEPKNVEEARLGSLFILGKIENVPKNTYRNFDVA